MVNIVSALDSVGSGSRIDEDQIVFSKLTNAPGTTRYVYFFWLLVFIYNKWCGFIGTHSHLICARRLNSLTLKDFTTFHSSSLFWYLIRFVVFFVVTALVLCSRFTAHWIRFRLMRKFFCSTQLAQGTGKKKTRLLYRQLWTKQIEPCKGLSQCCCRSQTILRFSGAYEWAKGVWPGSFLILTYGVELSYATIRKARGYHNNSNRFSRSCHGGSRWYTSSETAFCVEHR